MRRFLSAVLLALAAMPAQAWDDWAAHDKALFIGFNALSFVDVAQTKHVAEMGRETNRMLGRSPSNSEIYTYFLARSVLVYAVSDVLPAGARTLFLAFNATLSLDTVAKNYKLGFEARF